MTFTDNQEAIINAISQEIAARARIVAAEQYQPQRDADESDDYIKKNKDYISKMRNIRDQLEELFSGAYLGE